MQEHNSSSPVAAQVSSTDVQVRQFASCLFEPDDVIEIRLLHSGPQPCERHWCEAARLVTSVDSLVRENDGGWNITVGVNPRRDYYGSKAVDVLLARTVFVDFDGCIVQGALDRVAGAGLPDPTLVVSSGHGCHAYWRLDDPIRDLAAWKGLQKRLIALLDSDRSVHDAPRVMRLPGFRNHKAPPADCQIVDADPTRKYPVADLLRVLPSASEAVVVRPSAGVARFESSEKLAQAEAYFSVIPGVAAGSRNSTAFGHAAKLVKGFALNSAEALQVLRAWNLKNHPRLDDSELQDCLANAIKYAEGPSGCKLREPSQCSSAQAAEGNRPSAAIDGRGSGGGEPPRHRTAASSGGSSGDRSKKPPSQKLVELARDRAEEFFRDGDRTYATVRMTAADPEHIQTLPIMSKSFRRWLRGISGAALAAPAPAQALVDAAEQLDADTMVAGPEKPVAIRVAGAANAVLVDLCDRNGQQVRIDANGWAVGQFADAKFVRQKGMRSLMVPDSSGTIELLRPLLNVSDRDWVLIVGWLLSALRPTGPYLVLIVTGEQGAAKTTLCRLLRATIDPSMVPLRAEPSNPRDLVIAAENSFVLSFDNLAKLPPWLSDGLCRIATGGGFATRELYTNSDEVMFQVTRPILLNGISDFANRSDLIDRSLVVNLPAVDPKDRRTERDLWEQFERVLPGVLGGLYKAVAAAIANEPKVQMNHLPRMADAARWVTAAGPALGWQADTFVSAMMESAASAEGLALEGSVLALPLMQLIRRHGTWQGSASELLLELDKYADQKDRRKRGWPETPAFLGSALHRMAPGLRKKGYSVRSGRSSDGRWWELSVNLGDQSLDDGK